MQKLKAYFAQTWFGGLLLGLLTFAVWGKSIGYEFVWDDIYFVVKNPSIRSFANIPSMFTSLDAQALQTVNFILFRPLRTVMYSVCYAISPQPWAFHLNNLLWQTAAVVLLYATARLLFARMVGELTARIMAFLIAALFAVQPAISEVVCWVKSLDDIMATVFTLAATHALLRRKMWSSLVFFILALYSKESSVPFAAVAVLILIGLHRFTLRQTAPWAVAFFGVALIYMAHRAAVMGRSSQIDPISGGYAQTLIDTMPSIPTYFRLLWGIPPFSIDYTYMPSHRAILSTGVLAGLLLLTVWFVGVILTWRSEKHRPGTIGFVWLGLFFLPVSNILPMMQYMAERFLYLPMIGWFLALGALGVLVKNRKIIYAIFVILFVIWTPLSWSRAEIWHDEVTLFVRTRLENPKIARIDENAVVAIFRLPAVSAMFSLDEKTHALGVGTMPAGQGQTILESLATAHKMLPGEQRITSALGITTALAGDATNAIALLRLATHQSPESSPCWVDLASAYSMTKNYPDASSAFQTALRLNPTNIYALRRYSDLCWMLGDYSNAMPSLRTLHTLEPQNPQHKQRMEQILGK